MEMVDFERQCNPQVTVEQHFSPLFAIYPSTNVSRVPRNRQRRRDPSILGVPCSVLSPPQLDETRGWVFRTSHFLSAYLCVLLHPLFLPRPVSQQTLKSFLGNWIENPSARNRLSRPLSGNLYVNSSSNGSSRVMHTFNKAPCAHPSQRDVRDPSTPSSLAV